MSSTGLGEMEKGKEMKTASVEVLVSQRLQSSWGVKSYPQIITGQELGYTSETKKRV